VNGKKLGLATIKGTVTNHFNSIVRPACYDINEGEFIETENNQIDKNIPIKKIVTYSVPFMHQALSGEGIKACGLLELVTPSSGDKYYRVVIGYFDAYVSDRREKEYIKAMI